MEQLCPFFAPTLMNTVYATYDNYFQPTPLVVIIVFQLLDTLRGLAFLHSLKIVHGDIKGVRAFVFNFFISLQEHSE
jgi:serine/threonine protein kinase